jgi:hypothetical protein
VPFDDRDYAGTDEFPDLDVDVSFPYTPFFNTEADASVKAPAWLNDRTLYHNRGNTTFSGENSVYGDFFGLDDLFTEHPRVVDGMIDIFKTWWALAWTASASKSELGTSDDWQPDCSLSGLSFDSGGEVWDRDAQHPGGKLGIQGGVERIVG